MFQAVTRVPFDRLEIAVPAFATLILIPLTFSITQGILWGFILHAALHVVVGAAAQVTAGGLGPGGGLPSLYWSSNMSTELAHPRPSSIDELQKIKKLADKAIEQLSDEQLHVTHRSRREQRRRCSCGTWPATCARAGSTS